MKQFWIALAVLALGPFSALAEGNDAAAIRAAVMDYFEGARDGDEARLRRAFHVDYADMTVVFSDRFDQHQMSDVVVRWGSRETPADWQGEIISMNVINGQIASVVFDFNDTYLDLLQLAKIDGEWRIVNKLFTYKHAPSNEG